MPDHVHFLATFSVDVKMTNVVASWKRFTSNHAKLNWQRDFFDHRLRGDEGWREKSDYILQNPVRAELIEKYEDWPYVLLPAERQGRISEASQIPAKYSRDGLEIRPYQIRY